MGLRIGANEKIHVEIEGITAGEQWDVYATEGVENSPTHIKLDYKSMLVGEKDKTFDVTTEEIAVLKVTADLNEVGIIRGNQETRYLPIELQALQVEENPVMQYTATGVKQMDIEFMVLPLQGIDGLRFYKEETGTIGLVTFGYADLLPANARTSLAKLIR